MFLNHMAKKEIKFLYVHDLETLNEYDLVNY